MELVKQPLEGYAEVLGFPIAIETAIGSIRSGRDKFTDRNWATVMKHHYGFIMGTNSADSEEMDAYVRPNSNSQRIFVIAQKRPDTGAFDENKVMFGFDNEQDAKAAFFAHYDQPEIYFDSICEMTPEQLRMKLFDECCAVLTKSNREFPVRDQHFNLMVPSSMKVIADGLRETEATEKHKAAKDLSDAIANFNKRFI